jgi:hypothetical protein
MSQALQPQRRESQQFPGPSPQSQPQQLQPQQQQDYIAPQFSAPPIGSILPHINNLQSSMSHQPYSTMQANGMPGGMPMPNGMQPNGMQHNGQQYMNPHMMPPQSSQGQMLSGMSPSMSQHPHGHPVPQPRIMEPVAFERNGKKYTCRLEVRQQPVRARMCGFGDKVCLCPYYIISLECMVLDLEIQIVGCLCTVQHLWPASISRAPGALTLQD